MPNGSVDKYRLLPSSRRSAAAMSVIGAILLVFGAAFAYVGGFLSPGLLTQSRIIDTFQDVNGVHQGFRRNHTKGVCVAGRFEGNGNGERLSRAAVFKRASVPVIGRVAVAVGKPFVPDNETEVRSMALSIRAPGGEWRMGMNDIPVFPVRDPQAFYEQLRAAAPDPTTGKPDPAQRTAFLASHPETVKALDLITSRPFSSGFENASYNSLDAFLFTNAAGANVPVRWSMVAVDPFVDQSSAQHATEDKNYLFNAFLARLDRGPVAWRLIVTIGQAGDPTNDATIPWPADRETVDVGTLTIDHVEPEGPHNCRDVNFDPLVLPDGIEPSDDPLLSARSAAYSVSFTRRTGEPKSPSAVQLSSTKGRD